VIPLSMLAVMGVARVNLTDGLDSLAGHTAAVAYAAYGIIAAQYGESISSPSVSRWRARFGLLWFNAHRAEVFMGDTGSLALGATRHRRNDAGPGRCWRSSALCSWPRRCR
jgi:phospho-N-acetylmuramoyl-pentapeptide-transferase